MVGDRSAGTVRLEGLKACRLAGFRLDARKPGADFACKTADSGLDLSIDIANSATSLVEPRMTARLQASTPPSLRFTKVERSLRPPVGRPSIGLDNSRSVGHTPKT